MRIFPRADAAFSPSAEVVTKMQLFACGLEINETKIDVSVETRLPTPESSTKRVPVQWTNWTWPTSTPAVDLTRQEMVSTQYSSSTTYFLTLHPYAGTMGPAICSLERAYGRNIHQSSQQHEFLSDHGFGGADTTISTRHVRVDGSMYMQVALSERAFTPAAFSWKTLASSPGTRPISAWGT